MITNVATYQCILFQIIKTLENLKFCYEEIEQIPRTNISEGNENTSSLNCVP